MRNESFVILRSALWDPFGEAEWACAEPALSEAEGKDLLLLFARTQNKKLSHPDRSSAQRYAAEGPAVSTLNLRGHRIK